MTTARSCDLARCVTHRRHALGLTQEQVARRSGMDPGSLDYLEHSPAAAIPGGSLLRLASALETTVEHLRGGEANRARLIDDPEELEHVSALRIEPWPGGGRDAVMRIETA